MQAHLPCSDSHIPETVTPAAADAAGFWPVTTGYRLPSERWMLDRTLADFARTGTPRQLVGHPMEPEVWSGGPQYHDPETNPVPPPRPGSRWDGLI